MLPAAPQRFHALRWENDALTFVDQRCLPRDLIFARAESAPDILAALATGAVTGPRQIDLFAAFGVALARRSSALGGAVADAVAALRAACPSPSPSIERVLAAAPGSEITTAIELLAQTVAVDSAIAEHGAALLLDGSTVLTLGTSGALSTGGCGTAAAAIVAAHAAGKRVHACVCETRPLITGLRLTAFECRDAGVSCTVVPDSAASALMRTERIAAVLAGATGMAANGDVRAELGTYALAIAAAHHRVPFYVLLPRSAVDRSARSGDALPLAPAASRQPWDAGADSACGSFSSSEDRTPGNLITAIVTEYGVMRPPFDDALASLATRPAFAFVTRART